MSGGSYNYLYIKDVDEIFQNMNNLEAMADRLAKLGYASDATTETQELIRYVRNFEKRFNTVSGHLQQVWRAVEWWDSGDSDEENLKYELRRYRNESS